jgi:hypothetical protein
VVKRGKLKRRKIERKRGDERGREMLQVEEALAAVLSAAAGHAEPHAVPLQGALGLVLAEDVCAPDPLPPFRASIKVSLHCLPFLPAHPLTPHPFALELRASVPSD